MITVERRVEWAEQRLRELWEAMDAYLEREPVHVDVEDPAPGSYQFCGHIREEPPDELSLLAGDFIHNLRSSLDNLIWELAHASASNPHLLAFLIAETPADFIDRKRRVLAGVDPAIVFAIGTCQPFVLHEDGGLRGGDRLALLDNFWNDDKHRVPVLIPGLYHVATGTTWTGDDMPPAIQSVGERFIDGAIHARLDGWYGPRPYVERASLTFEPRFLTRRAPEHAVLRYAFQYMLAMVRNEILPRFAAFR